MVVWEGETRPRGRRQEDQEDGDQEDGAVLSAPSPACRLNPLPAVCFQNGGPLRTLDLEQASACQKTPALQANSFR